MTHSPDPNRTQMLANDPNRTQMIAAPRRDSSPSFEATITIKPIQCPVCKTFNPAGVMFCVDCGLIFDRALPDDAFGAPAVQLPVLIESSGREHTLRPGTTLVGREGDIQIADTRVSRRHAEVVSEAGVIAVADVGSTNGTSVNGTALAPGERRSLAAGDTVSFGGVELRLALPGEANKTLGVASNKTAALAAPPTVSTAAAFLVGDESRFPLHPGENTLGRKSDNDVCIPEPYVSGRHALLVVENGEVSLTDVGSTNGTVLNGAKLPPHQKTLLTPQDEIRLGSMTFHVEFGGQA
ncbi:MAG: hypothetical protein AMXMBFR81_17430 [Chthonomonas sp.]|nr:FHA domain-containing protein [Fimbriimonadaceae bacterium]